MNWSKVFNVAWLLFLVLVAISFVLDFLLDAFGFEVLIVSCLSVYVSVKLTLKIIELADE